MSFQNAPMLKDENNVGKVRRYIHQPLTIEHYGIHAKIQPNGKVVITGQAVSVAGEEVEYDEVEVPASLIFKLASLLKATRTIQFVSVTEAADVTALPEEEKLKLTRPDSREYQ